MQTPSEQLAKIIAKKLADADLILEADLTRVQSQLGSGTLKNTDWRVFVEKTTPDDKEGDDDVE